MVDISSVQAGRGRSRLVNAAFALRNMLLMGLSELAVPQFLVLRLINVSIWKRLGNAEVWTDLEHFTGCKRKSPSRQKPFLTNPTTMS